MKLQSGLKLLWVGFSVISLVACSSTHKKTDDAAINDANAAYNGDAQSSGAGDESNFGDQANNARHSQRVYYFDFDSDVVREEDRPAINRNGDYLLAHSGAKIMLEGHTDPRGSREYNIGLGERRAKAVAEMLTAKGVSPAQIRVVSYGAEKLASPGRSEEDYQQDRRVVLVYLQR